MYYQRFMSLALALRGFALLTIGLASAQIRDEGHYRAELEPYLKCSFLDGLQAVKVDWLRPGVTERTVKTAQGPKQVAMDWGARIMFAYPKADFFANLKAEKLPDASYRELKKRLIDSFDYVLASGGLIRRSDSFLSTLHGLPAYGLDRSKLEGGVAGIYLLFDDKRRIATTIYFLNQDPASRKVQTLVEYGSSRDRFLLTYSACIASTQTP